jgi:hypothetical protein
MTDMCLIIFVLIFVNGFIFGLALGGAFDAWVSRAVHKLLRIEANHERL